MLAFARMANALASVEQGRHISARAKDYQPDRQDSKDANIFYEGIIVLRARTHAVESASAISLTRAPPVPSSNMISLTAGGAGGGDGATESSAVSGAAPSAAASLSACRTILIGRYSLRHGRLSALTVGATLKALAVRRPRTSRQTEFILSCKRQI